MQIEVKCGCGDAECPEWAIVEVQGTVEPQQSFAGHLPGLEIGRLCAAAPPSAASAKVGYTFTVGYHELSGTRVSFKKPLLVIKKTKKAAEVEAGAGDALPDTELQVIGIIRSKILFKSRPKALISSKTPSQGK